MRGPGIALAGTDTRPRKWLDVAYASIPRDETMRRAFWHVQRLQDEDRRARRAAVATGLPAPRARTADELDRQAWAVVRSEDDQVQARRHHERFQD